MKRAIVIFLRSRRPCIITFATDMYLCLPKIISETYIFNLGHRTLYIYVSEDEDPWLVSEAKRGPREKVLGNTALVPDEFRLPSRSLMFGDQLTQM